MKKILAVLVAVACLLSLAVIATDDSDAEDALWFNGVHLTGDDSGTHWSYVSSSNTLTISGDTFTTSHDGSDEKAVLYDGRTTGLNLVIEGENTITGTGDVCAIFVKGDLSITGTGSLVATSGTTDTYGGINNHGSLSISGPTISARGSIFDVYVGDGGDTFTLNISSGRLNLMDKGLDVNGTINVSGTGVIFADEGGSNANVCAMKGITISGGTVTARATGSFDISVGHGNYVQSGGTVNLSGTGTMDVNGNITLHDGVINIGESGAGYRIAAINSGEGEGIFTMDGGTINQASATEGQKIICGERSMNIGSATITNLTPCHWNTLDACDLAEATAFKATSTGSVSLSFGSPTYTVTFSGNGGTGSMDPVSKSGEYTLPANGFTAPAGKVFKCWSVVIGSAAAVEKNVGQTINVTADTTVSAVWQDAPAATYTVSFDANGGTGTMNPVTGVSGEYTLPECTFTAPEGKTFKCWTIGDTEKDAGDKVTITADTTVKAVWKDSPSGSNFPVGAVIGAVVGAVVVIGVAVFVLKKIGKI